MSAAYDWLYEIDMHQRGLKASGYHLTVAIKEGAVHFHMKKQLGRRTLAFDHVEPIDCLVQGSINLLEDIINRMRICFEMAEHPLQFYVDKGPPHYTMPAFATGGFIDIEKHRPTDRAGEALLPPRPGIKRQARD